MAVASDIKKNVSVNLTLTDKISPSSKKINSTLGSMKTMMAGLSFSMSGLGGANFTKSFIDFQKNITGLGISSGATATELKLLSNLARDVGANTVLNTDQVATAMGTLAKSGKSVSEIMNMIQPLANLSIGTNTGIIDTANQLTTLLTAFNIEAKDTARISDLLATASTKTKGGLMGLSDGLKTIAPNFSSLGISLEEATAMIALLGNAGLEGSAGGMALNSMLKNLKAPSKDLTKYMRQLGVSVYDSQGNFRSMLDIVSEVSKATEGMTTKKQTEVFSKIFGEKGSKGILTLLNQGPEKVQAFLDSFKNISGNSTKMAGMRVNNLGGDIEGLNSSLDALKITMNSSASGPMRYFVQMANDMATSLNSVAKASPLLGGGLSLATNAASVLLGPMSQLFLILPGLSMAVKGLAASFIVLRNAGLVLGAVMMANPLGLAITGFAALSYFVLKLTGQWDAFTNSIASGASMIGNVISSIPGAGAIGSGLSWIGEKSGLYAPTPSPIEGAENSGKVKVEVDISSEGSIKSVKTTSEGIADIGGVRETK